MTGKQMRETLAAGGTVVGTFFQYVHHPSVVEMLPERGLDFVIVNTEHNVLDLADFLGLRWALESRGIACLVRVYNRRPEDVARACDMFPDGVVVPYVEKAEEVRRLVAAAKYRPLKGASLDRLLGGGEWPSAASREYVGARCERTFFCAMVESVRAVENIEAICSVPGLDAVLVGPNDLSVSMGLPEKRDHPDFVKTLRRVMDAAERHGVAAGAHFSQFSHVERLIGQGARFLPYSSDARLIQHGTAAFVEAIRERVARRGRPS